MFRFYHTFDLNSEIEKELLRASHLAQILIDEIDLFMLSKTLFKAIDNGVFIEIVIVSESNNKSMKLVNLCKRLIDQEVSIYWKLDEKLFTKKDFFAIFDKQYLISSRPKQVYEIPENLLRSKNDLFNGLAQNSQKINLLSGNIEIEFNVDKTIVFSNDEITINWKTSNAHQVIIQPLGFEVASEGNKTLFIGEDTKYTLEAKNNDLTVRKSLFVRVINGNDLRMEVEAFAPIVKNYIPIKSASKNENLYAAYIDQKIKISWNISSVGKLSESFLGKLELIDQHEFILTQNKSFVFTFKSANRTQTKEIFFHCFRDEGIFKKDYAGEIETKKQLINSLHSIGKSLKFLKDKSVKLFNIFNKK